MGKLIDIDEAYKVLTDYYHHRTEIQHKALKEAMERVPTVDAVEVVRCKDCRYYHIYWESNGHTEKGYGACDWINDNSVREDHFCSWGERREDG